MSSHCPRKTMASTPLGRGGGGAEGTSVPQRNFITSATLRQLHCWGIRGAVRGRWRLLVCGGKRL